PAPGSPELGSPPQQSLLTRQVSPCTWQPDAGWQIDEPKFPNGPQKWLQHVPQPLQVSPSTEQAALVSGAQVPTAWPETSLQMPVQHSLSCAQMSPIWVQNETCDGAAHWPTIAASLATSPMQLPLQHSFDAVHALPAVLHMVLIGVQVPLQIVLQHWPADVHDCPSERHCPPHLLPTHARPQQSAAEAHDAPTVPHCGSTHTCEAASQTFEQHSAPLAQAAPAPLQIGPASVMPTMPSPEPARSGGTASSKGERSGTPRSIIDTPLLEQS